MLVEIEQKFDDAMKMIFTKAKLETGYTATRFKQMLAAHGGLETAQMLLNNTAVSEVYTALWQRNRLDLTVEALILDPKWKPLFSDKEITIARDRLREYEFLAKLPLGKYW